MFWEDALEDSCPHNFEDEFVNSDGIYVCTLCGLCGDRVCDYSEASSFASKGKTYTILHGVGGGGGNGKRRRCVDLPLGRFPGSTYKSKYHTNERLAQVLMTGPRVPHCILFCLKAEYFLSPPGKYPPPEYMTKGDISRLCRNTPVPRDIQLVYRSSKPPHELMQDFAQYSERWYFIILSLGQDPPKPPEDHEVQKLKRFCDMAQNKWGSVRHVEGCQNPNIDCHRKYGCRKNFPNLYYVMAQLCRMLDLEHLLPCFPVNNQPKTLKDLDRYWELLCDHLDWPFEPWDLHGRSRPVHRQRFH